MAPKFLGSEVIREKVGVAFVVDKTREPRLRWFGPVQKKCIITPVRRCERLILEDMQRGSNRPKKY